MDKLLSVLIDNNQNLNFSLHSNYEENEINALKLELQEEIKVIGNLVDDFNDIQQLKNNDNFSKNINSDNQFSSTSSTLGINPNALTKSSMNSTVTEFKIQKKTIVNRNNMISDDDDLEVSIDAEPETGTNGYAKINKDNDIVANADTSPNTNADEDDTMYHKPNSNQALYIRVNNKPKTDPKLISHSRKDTSIDIKPFCQNQLLVSSAQKENKSQCFFQNPVLIKDHHTCIADDNIEFKDDNAELKEQIDNNNEGMMPNIELMVTPQEGRSIDNIIIELGISHDYNVGAPTNESGKSNDGDSGNNTCHLIKSTNLIDNLKEDISGILNGQQDNIDVQSERNDFNPNLNDHNINTNMQPTNTNDNGSVVVVNDHHQDLQVENSNKLSKDIKVVVDNPKLANKKVLSPDENYIIEIDDKGTERRICDNQIINNIKVYTKNMANAQVIIIFRLSIISYIIQFLGAFLMLMILLFDISFQLLFGYLFVTMITILFRYSVQYLRPKSNCSLPRVIVCICSYALHSIDFSICFDIFYYLIQQTFPESLYQTLCQNLYLSDKIFALNTKLTMFLNFSGAYENKESLSFKIIDTIAFLITLILVELKYAFKDIYPLTMTCFSMFIAMIFIGYRLKGKKILTFLFSMTKRGLIMIQYILICLKIDNYINWSWKVIFCLVWLFLLALMFYCIIIFFALCFLIFNGEFEKRKVIPRWTWTFLWGLGIMAYTYLIIGGIINIYDDNNPNLNILIIGFIIAIGFHGFILAYALLLRRFLKKFLKKLLLTHAKKSNTVNRNTNANSKRTLFLVDKQPSNFPNTLIMFSPTYFTTFAKSLSITNYANIKKMIMSISSLKKLKFIRNRSTITNSKNQAKDKIIEKLNEPISLPKHKNSVNEPNTHISPNHYNHHSPGSFLTPKALTARQLNASRQKFDSRMDIISLSDGDIDIASQIEYNNNQVDEQKLNNSNSHCVICFDKSPNAVLMNCGHGGMCYTCGLKIWKDKKKCFICREEIKEILQIDPNSNHLDIKKVKASIKLYKKKRNNEDYYYDEISSVASVRVTEISNQMQMHNNISYADIASMGISIPLSP